MVLLAKNPLVSVMLLSVLIHSEWLRRSIFSSTIVVHAYLKYCVAFSGLPTFLDVAINISTNAQGKVQNAATLRIVSDSAESGCLAIRTSIP